MFIIESKQAKVGAFEGIMLCEKIIVPSLLPILVISSTITNSSCSLIINKSLGFLTKKVLHLPKECTTAIIFGMIGGFPTGAILTHQLYKNNAIDNSTAIQIMRFNFCGGAGFIITAIGGVWLNSTKVGFALFAINVLSSIIFAIAQSIAIKSKPNKMQTISKKDFSSAVVHAVEASVNSVLVMCCYIILFSALCKLVNIPKQILPIIEITNGMFCTKSFSLEAIAAYLGFGGICVHFQLFSIINELKMKYYDFLLSRICISTISYFLGKLYVHIFAKNEFVYSNISNTTPKAFQVNVGLSIIFIIGCIWLVVDLYNKKSKYI